MTTNRCETITKTNKFHWNDERWHFPQRRSRIPEDRWCQRSRPAGGVCDKQIKSAFSSIFGQNGEQEADGCGALCAGLLWAADLNCRSWARLFFWLLSCDGAVSPTSSQPGAAELRLLPHEAFWQEHGADTLFWHLNSLWTLQSFRCLHGAAVRRGGGGGNYSVDSPGDETGRRVSGGWRLWSVFCWFEIRSRNVESGFFAEVLLIPSLRRGERRKPC